MKSDSVKPQIKQNPEAAKPLMIKGRLLPFRKEHRTNPLHTVTGAHAMRRAYFSNGISRRTREGKVISALEREIAQHRGFTSLNQLPVMQRIKAQLLVGNLIFLSLYEPSADSKTGLRDFTGAQNLVNRLTSELGLDRARMPIDPLEAVRDAVRKANP